MPKAPDNRSFAAMEQGKPIGSFFRRAKETGRDTMELAVMGVDRKYHRRRLRPSAFCGSKEVCGPKPGILFSQVKTVQMGRYKEYDDTNRFYQSLGFKELEVFPKPLG